MKKFVGIIFASSALICAQDAHFKVEQLTPSEAQSLKQAHAQLLDVERKVRAAHGDTGAAYEGKPDPHPGWQYAVCRSGYNTGVEIKQDYAFITSTYYSNCGTAESTTLSLLQ